MKLSQFKESACTCDKCKDLCKRPGWFVPHEAQAAMDAGLGPRLMCDRWMGSEVIDHNVDVLCPANPGYEGKLAPGLENHLEMLLEILASLTDESILQSGCTFQGPDGLCELHDKGLKPLEGRVASGCDKSQDTKSLHLLVARTWDTDEGRAAVARWTKEKDKEENGSV